ncbi:MAG: hypothetical protein LWX51_07895 [Deltaproteobacteria bacterium]|jgi:hypothetical protein|nr:hypothetical protein [Deltaproteobacteria bacterium]
MNLPYWEYFLSIEADLITCTRYIEFIEDNFETYSIEFARIIMAASSEFDTVAKDLCANINSTQKPKRINEYYGIITTRFSKFTSIEVQIPRYSISLKPWIDWSSTKSPDWWSKGYNKIKHDRTNNFSKACLLNALLSTTGLLAGILYYYKAAYTTYPQIDAFNAPKLFSIKDSSPIPIMGGGIFWDYNLP